MTQSDTGATPSPGRVVVGVDGSPNSRAALRFAITEARLRGAELQAVCAWRYPNNYGDPVMLPREQVDPKAVARRTLDEAIAAVDDEQYAVTPVTAQGSPAPALLAAAVGADLLVIGSRGRGGFLGLLLGSVSHQCVSHSPCPTVVVPLPDENAERDRTA